MIVHPEPDDSLARRLTHALEARPALDVPHDFAARVAASVPARAVAPARNLGRRVTWAGAGLLLLAMVVLAFAHQPAEQPLLYLFGAEFLLLTLWISLRPAALP